MLGKTNTEVIKQKGGIIQNYQIKSILHYKNIPRKVLHK